MKTNLLKASTVHLFVTQYSYIRYQITTLKAMIGGGEHIQTSESNSVTLWQLNDRVVLLCKVATTAVHRRPPVGHIRRTY